jgi:hypothetical protein
MLRRFMCVTILVLSSLYYYIIAIMDNFMASRTYTNHFVWIINFGYGELIDMTRFCVRKAAFLEKELGGESAA